MHDADYGTSMQTAMAKMRNSGDITAPLPSAMHQVNADRLRGPLHDANAIAAIKVY